MAENVFDISKKYGNLIIIEPIIKDHRTYWKCVCDCGNEVIVRQSYLESGMRSKCRHCAHLKDITGHKYGAWLVLEEVGKISNNHIYWRCQCSCGTFSLVSGTALRQGSSTNCGCKQHKIILGNKYGRLTPISYIVSYRKIGGKTNKIKQRRAYRCICECGNIAYVDQTSLISGKIKSCGCLSVDTSRSLFTTHGLSGTKAYEAFLSRQRRELKQNLDIAWTPLMEICLRDYQPVCVVCGSAEQLATDHVLPLSKGNGLCPGNAVTLCRHHNSMKGNRSLDNLPIEMATKIREAAESFRVAWSGVF